MEQQLEEGERGIWREEESKLELTGETARQLSRSLILTQELSVLVFQHLALRLSWNEWK